MSESSQQVGSSRECCAIRDGQVPPTPHVIPVQPSGSLPPFFCIGAGPLFRPLALRLGTDRPFLSLMPALLPEIRRLAAPYRLEQIAAHLVNSILDYQNDGPYYLGGWSASGVVAYETARQIMAKGHEVALLVMFDSLNPAFPQSRPQSSWLDAQAKKIKFHTQELLRLKVKNSPAYVAEKANELRRRITSAALQIWYKTQVHINDGRLANPEQIVQLAVNSYRPTPYIGRLAFFSAADRPSGDVWDYSLSWRQLVTGEFKVFEVPGDHRSMFHEPNVGTLANKMMNYLGQSEPRP